jgi:hypothetical protein
VAKYNLDGSVYYENLGLHYLCRPDELEGCCVKDFFENYKAVRLSLVAKKRKRKRGEPEVWPFKADTCHFKHPSTKKRKEPATPKSPPKLSSKKKPATPRTPKHKNPAKSGKSPSTPRKPPAETHQGVTEKEKSKKIKLLQWMFPNTVKFKNHILKCPVEDITNDMEIYAQEILVLLLPHRCLDDLKSSRSPNTKPFTMKLREVNESDLQKQANEEEPIIFKSDNLDFLQNIQDGAYNSLRYKVGEHDLASVTVPFNNYEGAEEATSDVEDKEEQQKNADTAYKIFLQLLDDIDHNDTDPSRLSNSLHAFSFRNIRLKGKKKCGFNDKLQTPTLPEGTGTPENDFVTYHLHLPTRATATTTPNAILAKIPA